IRILVCRDVDVETVAAKNDIGRSETDSLVAVDEAVVVPEGIHQRGCLFFNGVVIAGLRAADGGLHQACVTNSVEAAQAAEHIDQLVLHLVDFRDRQVDALRHFRGETFQQLTVASYRLLKRVHHFWADQVLGRNHVVQVELERALKCEGPEQFPHPSDVQTQLLTSVCYAVLGSGTFGGVYDSDLLRQLWRTRLDQNSIQPQTRTQAEKRTGGFVGAHQLDRALSGCVPVWKLDISANRFPAHGHRNSGFNFKQPHCDLQATLDRDRNSRLCGRTAVPARPRRLLAPGLACYFREWRNALAVAYARENRRAAERNGFVRESIVPPDDLCLVLRAASSGGGRFSCSSRRDDVLGPRRCRCRCRRGRTAAAVYSSSRAGVGSATASTSGSAGASSPASSSSSGSPKSPQSRMWHRLPLPDN